MSAVGMSTERVQLLLTLVPYLLERGRYPSPRLRRSSVSPPEQMRRMVEKLTVIGLPGDDGYWQQPHELFDINWDLLDLHGRSSEITQAVGLRALHG